LTQRTTRIAGVAALAVVSMIAATAQAQPSVRVGDLNLATVAGKATFDHRVNVAADQVCGDERNFSIRDACEAAVRSEVGEKLAAISPATQFAAAPVRAQRTIRIVDLNLATAAGKATFAQRVTVTANQVCGGERDLTIQHACRVAVRNEATEKLAMIAPATQLAAR
jgi:UrcA family protein